jgi:hypothetical protein
MTKLVTWVMLVQELRNRYQKAPSDVVDKQNSQAVDGRTAISVFVSTVIAPKVYKRNLLSESESPQG